MLDLAYIGIKLSRQRKKKALIRLSGCTNLSAPLLFAYGINRFFDDEAHIRRADWETLWQISSFVKSDW